MKKYLSGCFAALLVVLCGTHDVLAAHGACFGPKIYTHNVFEGAAHSDSFSARSGAGTIRLTNGNADGTQGVRNAAVTLNGVPIFSPEDFAVGGIRTADIQLQPENILTVQLDVQAVHERQPPHHPDRGAGVGFGRILGALCVELARFRDGCCFGPPSPPPAKEPFLTIAIYQDDMPPAVMLSAAPSAVAPGETATLFWASSGAASCTIVPDIGEVAPNGSLSVFPTQSTTYTVTALGPGGAASAQAVVSVRTPPLEVRITRPTDGAHTTDPAIDVSGTVRPPNADVAVNGTPAIVTEGDFFVQTIELSPGANTLNAVATLDDARAEDQVTVHLSGIDLEPVHIESIEYQSDHRSLKMSGVITVRIANHGPGDPEGPFHVAVFEDADLDGLFDPDADNLLAEWAVDAGPPAGDAMEVRIPFQGRSLFRDNRILVSVDSRDTIPETDKSNNVATLVRPGPDASASWLRGDDSRCPGEGLFTVRIGNAGDVAIDPGLPVSVYDGDPQGNGTAIATTVTTTALLPGAYEDVVLSWAGGKSAGPIFAVADDDGTGHGRLPESDTDNNRTNAPGPVCMAPPALPNSISGQAMDALTGAVLPGARITLHADMGGLSGEPIARQDTHADGVFAFWDLSPGAYILSATRDGYLEVQRPVSLGGDQSTSHRHLVLSPVPRPDEIRIVLTWDDHPRDLDAHLTGPNPDGCRHHCNYWNRRIPGAVLDVDAGAGFGPETITLTKGTPGIFRYYVHDFTNRNTKGSGLSMSGARVAVYFGSGSPHLTFEAPARPGTVWHALQIDGLSGEVTPIHRLSFQAEPGKIDFPVITSLPITTLEWGTDYIYPVTAEDPDDDSLTFDLLAGPAGMVLDSHANGAGQTISLAPALPSIEWFQINTKMRPWTLAWSTSCAVECRIEPDIGEVPCSGGIEVAKDKRGPFTLIARNPAGEVNAPPNEEAGELCDIGFTSEPICDWSPGEPIALHLRQPTCVARCEIEPDVGPVSCEGTVYVHPTAPTPYHLTAVDDQGNPLLSRTVSVPVMLPPSITIFDADRTAILPGDRVTLNWRTGCAEACRIDQGIGEVACTEGSIVVTPEVLPRIYTLTASRDSTAVMRTITVQHLKPTISFGSAPAVIKPGESAILSWAVDHATACRIEPDIGPVANSGSITVRPSRRTIYRLTAQGPGGTRSANAIVSFVRPTAQIHADPKLIQPGQSTTLTWVYTDADTCVLMSSCGLNINNPPLGGSLVVTPGRTTTYTIIADGPGGSASDSVSVSFPKPTVTVEAEPDAVFPGQSANLTWRSTLADQCAIRPGIGDVSPSGSMTVFPTDCTTYTIRATGPGGGAVDHATVACLQPAIEFGPAHQTIPLGESTTLTWNVIHGQSTIWLTPIGPMPASGSMPVSPNETTDYSIRLPGCGGMIQETATVQVICPPSLTFMNPDGIEDRADTSYLLRWRVVDCGSNATTSLYYTTAPDSPDTTLIASDIHRNPDGGAQFLWDTRMLPEGTYHIRAVIRDVHHDPVTVHADHPVIIDHSAPIPRITLAATDGEAHDGFGYSVAISDRYAVVGAPYHDQDSGAAYIFERKGRTWKQVAKVMCTHQCQSYRRFGSAMALDGDTIIVGAEGRGWEDDSSAAFVFTRLGEQWIEKAEIFPRAGSRRHHFGRSIVLAGDRALIGAPGFSEGANGGAVYPFTRQDGAWTEQSRLLPGGGGSLALQFGHRLWMSGNRLIVGTSPYQIPSSPVPPVAERTFFFQRDDNGWHHEATLTGMDFTGLEHGAMFGAAVHMHQNRAIVGSPFAENHSGAAFLFSHDAQGGWTESARLMAGDAATGGNFGTAVRVDDEHAYVGTGYSDGFSQHPGDTVYVFRNQDGVWREQHKMRLGDNMPKVNFGQSIAMANGFLLVGADRGGEEGVPAGVAYIFSTCIADLEVSPDTVAPGQTVTLYWNTELADTCRIEPDIGHVETSGSIRVTPDETTTYTLQAVGPYGRTTRKATVRVSTETPTVIVTADPDTIISGQATTLAWHAQNATGVVITPDIGAVALQGTQEIMPLQTTTYTITATGPGGTTSDNVKVTVEDQPQPTAHLEAEPAAIPRGETTLLRWTTTHAESVTITPSIGSVVVAGVVAVSPTSTTTYTLTATGTGGTVTQAVTVTVTDPSITIQISSPLDGQTLSTPHTMGEGIIVNPDGIETGVTINGNVATVYGEMFVANGIALEPGENSVTAVATDTEGNTARDTISVHSQSEPGFIRLTANPRTGISPLEAKLTITGSITAEQFAEWQIKSWSVTMETPGTMELFEIAPDQYNLHITGEGIYYFTAQVTDHEGNFFTDTIAIVVLDGDWLESYLHDRWSGMIAALAARDIEGAIAYFSANQQDLYRRVYTALYDDLPRMVAAMKDIELIEVGENDAGFRIKKEEVRGGRKVTTPYRIHFVQDGQGIWRIYRY